ncbi:MAG TPA: hypothetical protein VMS64_22540 [Candidatus Methylomirabilis sp.]|nr:hypothetical protein [Candidatus Methylomirabilis sp.]
MRNIVSAMLTVVILLGGSVPARTEERQASDCPNATTVERADNATTVERADIQVAASTPERAYAYPYRDPYLATMMAAALNPTGVTPGLKRHVVHVPVLPGRNQFPSLEGRGQVSVALYRQSGPAPLLFIVGGIGSSPYFGLGSYFAALFHREGFHVVILPSPMNWNFALAASRSGVPGYVPDDARDLYDVMQKTRDVLTDRYRLEITGIDYLGASLGALEGAYVSVIDADQRKIGIDRYLLIDPPLDLTYALKKLDRWEALERTFGKDRAERLGGAALAIVQSYSAQTASAQTVDDRTAIARMARRFSCFTTEELQFLISEYVQTTVPELVYVTQAIHDQHLLTIPPDRVTDRLEQAKAFTLADYTEKIVMPSLMRRASLQTDDVERLSDGGSLTAILDRLRDDPRVYIMYNADDVLADPGSINDLKAAMGDHMIVYPFGGHLGNLWYGRNKDAILAVFGSPTPAQRAGGEGMAIATRP